MDIKLSTLNNYISLGFERAENVYTFTVLREKLVEISFEALLSGSMCTLNIRESSV